MVTSGIKCSYYLCSNSKYKIPGLKMFRIPKTLPLCHEWVKNSGNPNLVPMSPTDLNKMKRICEKHFRTEDILDTGRLMHNAVPIPYNRPVIPEKSPERILLRPKSPKQYRGATRARESSVIQDYKFLNTTDRCLEQGNKINKPSPIDLNESSSHKLIESPNVDIEMECFGHPDTASSSDASLVVKTLLQEFPEVTPQLFIEERSQSSLRPTDHRIQEIASREIRSSSLGANLDIDPRRPIPESSPSVSSIEQEDDTDVFFRSMAMTAKTFYPTILADLKKKICGIVMDSQIENEMLKASMVRPYQSSSLTYSAPHPKPDPLVESYRPNAEIVNIKVEAQDLDDANFYSE